MKYARYLLFLMIIFLVPNVYASDYKLNSHISATNGGTKNRYGGLENYNYGSYGTYTFGTRYQGRLGNIETYIDYPFEANTTYTLTYNMNTEDFKNSFGSSYWWDCSQTMTNSNATVQSVNYISYKKIKFTFTPTSNTTCIFVSIRSTNPSSTAITQITNWQLDSIYLYDPDYQGGSSGGSGGSGGTSTPTPDPNQNIIDNNNQNTSDIIDNANENTKNIIDNQNQNQEQTNQLLGSCNKNYFDLSSSYLSSTATYTINNNTGTLNVSNSSWKNVRFAIPVSAGTYNFSFSNSLPNNIHVVLYYNTIADYTNSTWVADMTTTNKNITLNNGYLIVNIYDTSNSAISYSISGLKLTNTYTSNYILPNQSVCTSKLDDTKDSINNLNDNITSDNVDSGVGSDFFEDFSENTHGLSGIITIPLQAIQDLASNQCQTLTIPLPFTDSTITLPCMTEYYQEHIPTLYSLLQTIIYGFMAYRILIDIFAMVKGFKDPDNDKIEVLDL